MKAVQMGIRPISFLLCCFLFPPMAFPISKRGCPDDKFELISTAQMSGALVGLWFSDPSIPSVHI